MKSIPLVDLSIQTREAGAEIEAAIARVVADNAFILGPAVEEFEAAYARFIGVGHCVGVANGTDALELALRAAGVGAGDEVILPANTFIASALAAARIGATPVLVDCDPEAHLIDPAGVEAALSPRTRAIVPVHLFGQMAPLEAIEAAARRAGIPLVEDAAQAHGASRHGRPAGGVGVAASTSFYPGKNLGAYGDAGAVLTGDAALAQRVRTLRNYGSERRYEHPEIGFNSRLDALQAAVLLAKLAHLARWNEARRAAAARYHALLESCDWIRTPATLPGNEHVWHLYVVRVPRRDALLGRLNAAGIGAASHYPTPLHRTGAFAHLGHPAGAFPVAERLADEVLSLPLYPGITEAQQARVVQVLAQR